MAVSRIKVAQRHNFFHLWWGGVGVTRSGRWEVGGKEKEKGVERVIRDGNSTTTEKMIHA